VKSLDASLRAAQTVNRSAIHGVALIVVRASHMGSAIQSFLGDNTDMHRRPSQENGKSPFLTNISIIESNIVDGSFPFTLPVFGRGDFNIKIRNPITIIAGENGTGKSTLLEAIAYQCKFPLGGGNQNHFYDSEQGTSELAPALRLSWRRKISQGFFVRAESFFNLSTYIDELAKDDPGIIHAYGGKSLHNASHGEAFMAFFENRLKPGGIYLLDEPEAALSPSRQIEFLKLLILATVDSDSQIILATHSPLLMSLSPDEILYLNGSSAQFRSFESTPNFLIYKDFISDHRDFIESVKLSL
jgi:predicted ATPase